MLSDRFGLEITDFDEIALAELFTVHPLLHELSLTDAMALVKLVDDRMSEIYLKTAHSIEAALALHKATLIANL